MSYKVRNKGLTNEEIENIKNSINSFILPKGTLLYRTQPQKYGGNVKSTHDEDTGKIGTYFSNSPHIPLGMVLEYKKPLNLCVYKTNKNLNIYIGKYAFRSLEPKRFFKTFKNWKQNKNTFGKPKNKIYWNHFDKEAYPIIDLFDGENWKYWNETDIAEIFINNEEDYDFIEIDRLVTIEEAKKFLTNELDKLKIEKNNKLITSFKVE